MDGHRAAILLIALAISPPAAGQPRQQILDRPTSGPMVGRWVRQLASELDHLQEDLLFERGRYPRGLSEQVEQVSLAVAHFQRMRLRTTDQRHLRRDFQEMDRRVHDLVRTLERSRDPWLRRQAARIRYADEQLHYALQRQFDGSGGSPRDLLARHAHLLENLARDLQQLEDRVNRRNGRLSEAIEEFVDRAEHFHEVVEQGVSGEHLRRDLQRLDEAWRRVVERLNRSAYTYYFRSAAQNIDDVLQQIDEILRGRRRVVDAPTSPDEPPPRRRPAIEFEIPGIGRFQIPR
jgi:exonuclease VII large subunit